MKEKENIKGILNFKVLNIYKGEKVSAKKVCEKSRLVYQEKEETSLLER
jgi:hypothetical protein